MQEAFLEINGVKTSVATFGRWVEEDNKDIRDIILLIPGNPGVPGFYKTFMEVIYEKTKFPCWIVGHAGHTVPKNNKHFTLPPLKGNEELYNLHGQIKHKESFIEKYVPENARLHLIGHSIGSEIILNLLKTESINKRIVDVKLLFPTFERMAETAYGKFLNKLIRPIVFLIVFFSWIFTILPTFLQTFLLYIYMWVASVSKFHLKSIMLLIQPQVLENVFFMAFDELDTVKERDNEVFIKNIKKIKVLYGEKDGWAPKEYYEKLKKDIPQVDAECSTYDHAFVLRQSREVGSLVASWF